MHAIARHKFVCTYNINNDKYNLCIYNNISVSIRYIIIIRALLRSRYILYDNKDTVRSDYLLHIIL